MLLASCVRPPAESGLHASDVEASAVLHAWHANASLPPVPDDCREELRRLRVVVDDDTAAWCGRSVALCLRTFRTGLFGLGDRVPVVIAQPAHYQPRWIAHEVAHHVSKCSGMPLGDDSAHADERVWKPHFGSVEQRAAEAIARATRGF